MVRMASPKPIPPTNKKYQCPMCFQDNNPVGFGRKSDFKKHLHNFHGADVAWICRTRACHLSFATERAYSTHAKEAHRMDALPSSAARTELCPQLVFSCGFANCKDRIFETYSREDSSNCRDKYFEHIAKHFEDGFDVCDWEYHIQIQNLMRQSKVKPIWKSCIWPKVKRQQLVWKPRSSGDLRRMLECRHLGNNVSTLVRLAYILGTPPFTSSNTPPPSEIDIHFQLPFRSQCLIDTEIPSSPDASVNKTEAPGGGNSSSGPKQRTSMPQAVLSKLPNRLSRRASRPSTPASAVSDTHMRDSIMKDEPAVGPHPGTPISIPKDSNVPNDAPTFAPDGLPVLSWHHNASQPEPEQPQHFADTQPDPPYVYPMSQPENGVSSWGVNGTAAAEPDYQGAPFYAEATPVDFDECYNYPLSSSQTPIARPPTPVPDKRPASWSRAMSMESIRPAKRITPYGSPCPDEEIPPAMMYGSQGPTSVPMHMAVMDGHGCAYDLPMRMCHDEPHPQSHGGFSSLASLPPQMQLNSPTTFFYDDEGRF